MERKIKGIKNFLGLHTQDAQTLRLKLVCVSSGSPGVTQGLPVGTTAFCLGERRNKIDCTKLEIVNLLRKTDLNRLDFRHVWPFSCTFCEF